MVKKISIILVLIILALSICGNVKAETVTRLETVEKSSELKYFNDNKGYITKSIIECDEENGEVTIEAKYVNDSIKKVEVKNDEYTEIFLVIDDSGSMASSINGVTMQEELVEQLYLYVDKIYDNYSNVKVGLIKFSSSNVYDGATEMMCNLTTNKQNVVSAINKYKNTKPSEYAMTNIQAGLKKADDNFSDKCNNRVIVLFTDGAPNQDLEESDRESKNVSTNTKNELLRIGNKGTNIISMMASIATYGEGEGGFETAKEQIEYIFGTEEKPTAGSFYYISTENKNEIWKKVISETEEVIENSINNVKITEYFPSEITDNFNFSYVGKPSVGNVSNLNVENRNIIWNIGLTEKEATLQYKLKLKNMANKDILNKIISINEKVELLYENEQGNKTNVTQTSTPKIRLAGYIDETIIEDDIPATGENLIPIIVLYTVIVVGVVMSIRFAYNKYSK